MELFVEFASRSQSIILSNDDRDEEFIVSTHDGYEVSDMKELQSQLHSQMETAGLEFVGCLDKRNEPRFFIKKKGLYSTTNIFDPQVEKASAEIAAFCNKSYPVTFNGFSYNAIIVAGEFDKQVIICKNTTL